MAGMTDCDQGGKAGPPEAAHWSVATAAALDVRGLTYRFDPDSLLFDNLSFSIQKGEFVSLLAPSGVGKTTLFRLIAGLLEPNAGEIRLSGGEPVLPGAGTGAEAQPGAGTGSGLSAPPRGKPKRLGLAGYMPQRDGLMPWRTVLDNAALGLEVGGMPKGEARRRVRELLPSFGLEQSADRLPAELSGGMRQRVSFLRTLLAGQELLLLDEPFSALDAMTRLDMQEWLLQVWEEHRKTILFITHDVDEALFLSDRVLVACTSPIGRLEEFRVPLDRPRKSEAMLDASLLPAKREILRLLRAGRSGGQSSGEPEEGGGRV
jgi:putative hydroxymethylpyrimidine transport system ATP-binding protein